MKGRFSIFVLAFITVSMLWLTTVFAQQPECVENFSTDTRALHGTSTGCMAMHDGAGSTMYFQRSGGMEKVDLIPNGVARIETISTIPDPATVLRFSFKMATQVGGSDALELFLSPDGGASWVNVIDAGGILSPPPEGFPDVYYYEGYHDLTTCMLDIRNICYGGCGGLELEYRWEVRSDNSGSGENVYLSDRIEEWKNPLLPLNPITSADVAAGNTMATIFNYSAPFDPRVEAVEVTRTVNGIPDTGWLWNMPLYYMPFLQFEGLSNGASYVFGLTLIDSFGNRSETVYTPAIVPVNTGSPTPSPVKFMNDPYSGDQVVLWYPQTAQVTTAGNVDITQIYTSPSSQGPWTLQATYINNSQIAWADGNGQLNPTTTFYKVVHTKDGVSQ